MPHNLLVFYCGTRHGIKTVRQTLVTRVVNAVLVCPTRLLNSQNGRIITTCGAENSIRTQNDGVNEAGCLQYNVDP